MAIGPCVPSLLGFFAYPRKRLNPGSGRPDTLIMRV